MAFFTYSQNNSGGSFDVDTKAGISRYVIVEAGSAASADAKAEKIGLYFDGVGDCECCGNRWYGADDRDGAPTPSVYGEDVSKPDAEIKYQWIKGPEGYVHYADGRIEPFGTD